MSRRDRKIEIFSLSALDLFASAMGAFVLLAVMMLPYYHKGKELEDQIGKLEPQAAQSESLATAALARAQAAAEDLAAIEDLPGVDPSPENQAVAVAEARRRALQGQIAAITGKIEQARIEKAKRKAEAKAAAKPAKPTSKVTFRFLGLKTDAERYLILVDGAARIKERAGNLPAILKSILEVMGPQKNYAIAFYRYVDGRLVYDRWPASGFTAGGKEARSRALDFLRGAYDSMGGGSPTLQGLRRAVAERPDAIILLSDGVVFPRHNEGKSWQKIVEDVTRDNTADVEINAVAIGIFNRNAAFWSFLNELRKRNGGDLKAIPP